jgi:hypothetical protein
MFVDWIERIVRNLHCKEILPPTRMFPNFKTSGYLLMKTSDENSE